MKSHDCEECDHALATKAHSGARRRPWRTRGLIVGAASIKIMLLAVISDAVPRADALVGPGGAPGLARGGAGSMALGGVPFGGTGRIGMGRCGGGGGLSKEPRSASVGRGAVAVGGRLRGGGPGWTATRASEDGSVGGGRRGRRPRLMPTILTLSKFVVTVCGAMWCYGCMHGLWTVARVSVRPGGLEYIEEQSSHGLRGVGLFVAFTSSLLGVQLFKLKRVLSEHTLPEIRRAFLGLGIFNLFFVYMCTWRFGEGLLEMSKRDAMIVTEAACMLTVVVLCWLKQPWRGKGRRMGADKAKHFI